jgi:hypothetical protein
VSELSELIQLCRAAVYVHADEHKEPFSVLGNPHRSYYQDVEEYLREDGCYDETGDVNPDVLREMVKRDQMVRIQFYTRTPVGFYVVYHYDTDKAISQALEIARREE